MINFGNYLKQFIKKGGAHIFTASVLSKVSAFVISIIIVRIFDKNIYGNIVYVAAILNTVKPFTGFGANFSLLRYGSITQDGEEKKELFAYSLNRGILASTIITFLFIALSKIITKNMPGSRIFLIIYSFQFITLFPELALQSFLRIQKKNKLYSITTLCHSFSILLLSPIFAILLGSVGYVLYITFSPAIIFILMIFIICITKGKLKIIDFLKIKRLKLIGRKEYWKYGLFVGLGSVASQIQFSLDNIFLGNMIGESAAVALYKIGTVIPFNLIFIPAAFMTTNFVYIAENHNNKAYLTQFIHKYWIIFGIITTVIIVIIYLFNEHIITVLFGSGYGNSAEYLKIFLIGLIPIFMIRIPLGNLLGAVGKANWNVVNSVSTLLVNGILDYILINEYGVKGAAYATNIAFWFSGIITLFLYKKYLKLCKN